ncbi:MAG: [NiFe] hydrogenase metallocenter assembly protein HypF [uncultured Thiotrichaceae bacterium]|uniref:Carbamoyltransferase HypF n=1 Tax=uncultured Thiotrichaceae bacterium TaxID=298394 RepID=A0A6S6U3T3_9GAMM|nr:MAG: [NiFe] hydrogenase metallocenter assembly protein HypF [uncultured Thiotrichaceae bacterium]
MAESRHLVLTGKVQGVGFRPFVYRIAMQYQLVGWVRNTVGYVEILAQGSAQTLDQFQKDLMAQAPTISEPKIRLSEACESDEFDDFKILASEKSDKPDIHIPADFYSCPDCIAEIQDPNNRRYQYPFINCTQCGPRYTLIEKLPYDRPNTSMASFRLCETCQQEYDNPLDRRFHAEPTACADCGPQLQYRHSITDIADGQAALQACIRDIQQGQIVAVKGVGGYHLICDASNDSAIAELRRRKGRPDKPLAVLFPAQGSDELKVVKQVVKLNNEEADLLRSPARPIVLVEKRSNELLSELIAPNLGEIGVMLAYSPLHHLLLNELNKPLVATSANFSGEPVLTNPTEVEERLGQVCQSFLHHNRPIVRPADDSVFRRIAGKCRPIRLGRGHAPIEMALPFTLAEPLLACGSHMKNTVALAWGNRLVVSPHIGDLDSPRSMHVFEQTLHDLQALYQVQAKQLICDAHPHYASTRWAQNQGLPVHKVQHHKAHASAVLLEHWNKEPHLVFTWDGTGYGDDHTMWGGEAFYGTPGNWQRVASIRPFHLPGGDKAGREPWRSAAALSWEEDHDWEGLPANSDLLKTAWQQGINSPKTSSIGRLFDAASAFTGLTKQASFEGQGPMQLEQCSQQLFATDALPMTLNEDGIWQADWSSLLAPLQDAKIGVSERATLFHSVMAHTLLEQAKLIQKQHPFTHIGLSGGVFQNRRLTDYVVSQLELEPDYTVHIPEILPVNDAGISAGQIIEAASQTNLSKRRSE